MFAGTYAGPGLLQQLAGQVLGLTILQRRANGTVPWCNSDDGALAGNVESQQMIDRTAAGPACALVEDHGDEAGFGPACTTILHAIHDIGQRSGPS